MHTVARSCFGHVVMLIKDFSFTREMMTSKSRHQSYLHFATDDRPAAIAYLPPAR